jgi:glycine cleavage system H protein
MGCYGTFAILNHRRGLMFFYTTEHEWVDSKSYRVGLSCFAQKELGEIVYLKLPPVGLRVNKGDELCILESTKSASDMYAPYSGVVTCVNQEALEGINQDPEGLGWLVEITPSEPLDPNEFLSYQEYKVMLES